MPRSAAATRVVIAVMALTGCFYAVTLRPGFPWGDDFAAYLSHARNIVSGRPYANIGYIYNPLQPEVGPPAYPPFFPVVLAPVVAAANLDSKAIKAEVAVFFLAALWAIYTCLRWRLAPAYAAAVVAFLAFNPFLWPLKDNPGSDVPFLFLLFVTFDRIFAAAGQGWKTLRHSVLVGVLLYLCFACRAAGIVLFPSLLVAEVLGERRLPRRGVWISVMIGSAGVLLQMWALHGVSSYADQLRPERIFNGVMIHHLAEYAWTLHGQFLGIPHLIGAVFVIFLLGLGLAGYVLTLRHGVTVTEVFAALYLVLILAVWTSDWDLRFLLPVLPLWLFYIAAGIVRLRDVGRVRLSAGLASVIAAFVAFGYIYSFAHASYAPDPSGTNHEGFLNACQFVRQKTPQDVAILFSKPRLLALLTGRKSAVYPLRDADEIIKYGRQIGAGYVITGEPFENDRQRLIPLVAARPELFEPVFQSGGFRVYRIRISPAIGPAAL